MKGQRARTMTVMVLLLAASATLLAQNPVAAGYRDFGFGPLVAPTGEKPESKLWWNDGSWWGVLWNMQLGAHHIYRFDWPNQSWIDTGTPADDRSNTKVDVKWDGASNKLYVVSHIYTTSASATTDPNTWSRLYRYTYASGTYSQDSGFPVTVTRGQSEALVIDKDTTGILWVTFVQSSKVYINHSTTGDNVWGTPFLIPASLAARQTSSDDISSVIAFGPGKIGVMWSNQVGKKFFFAVHNDGDLDTQWEPEKTALPGPGGTENSDDHINLKSVQTDSSGRVFAAIKTSLTGANNPLVMLLVRDTLGDWSNYVFGQVKDNQTRPIVLLDTPHNKIYMFAASPDAGTPMSIYYKTSDMTNINFPAGKGAPFIQSVTDVGISNGTSTKQNVDSTTGLLVLASDPASGCGCSGSHVYLHNTLTLNGAADPTISSFSPTKAGAGTVVTVNGSNLLGANIAAFNGMVGTSLSIISDTQLQVTVPSGASNGSISVTDPNGGVAFSSGSFTVQAGTIATTTTLASSANPSTPGQQVTFTATVNHSSGAAVPTGTISFLDGSTTLGVGVLDNTGTATFATSSLAQGTHSITAKYSGDGKYVKSTSSALSQVVNAALVSTTTTVASSANPSTVGQSVTFTATVTPASGTTVPTGTVTFLDGATTLGTGALDATGKATFATSSLTQGTHSITASYGGSSSFTASTSSPLSQGINGISLVATTTTLSSSANPSAVGQTVTFTATVTPTSGTGTPTGTVTFLDGATTLGTGALDATGTAKLATSALAQGTHSITASYGGDGSFGPSGSSALSQVVNAALVSTTTTVASSANPSGVGQLVTFTATVTPASGTTVPTGMVTFLDGATTLGTGALDNTGKTTFATSALAQGTHSITASYTGDGSFAASTSSALSQAVNAAVVPTLVSVTPSAGSGASQTFQYVFADANGATAIKSVRTLIGVGTANAGSCQFMYDLGSNTLSVMKDNGSGWGSSQQVGVSGSIANSQCSVDTGISSASISGSNLTLNLATTFTASFAGSKTIYMLALDVTGLSTGFKSKGTWTTANIIATAPSPVSVTPSSGSGPSQAFQYVFSDVNGAWYVKSLRVLINATTSNVSACEFYYTVSNNSLQAMKDDGSTWGSSLVLGQAGTVSNSQCSVDTAASNAVSSGNNITLNLAVTFATGFTGAKNNYMQAYDNGGLTSGFVLKGTWTTGP